MLVDGAESMADTAGVVDRDLYDAVKALPLILSVFHL